MNSLIQEIYRTKQVRDAQGNPINPYPTVTTEDMGIALYQFVRKIAAKNTLEIGMAYGLSTLFLCQAHRDEAKGGRHTAIDPMESADYRGIGLLNVKRAGLEDVFRFFEACSHEVLPQLLREKEQFDFIFIDGMHLFDYTLVDFFYADFLLQTGGYIVFDDVWMPSIRKVVRFITRDRHYRLAPEFFNGQAALGKRLKRFSQHDLSDPYQRAKFKRIARFALQNPFDLSSVFFGAYLSAKGCLNHWCVQKIADDDRPWFHYQSF